MSIREIRMGNVSLTTLHCLMGVAGKPAYVKAASEQEHHAGAAPTACADGMMGQYPCDSRESTYVSALKIASAKADGAQTDALESSLMKFAKFWQIEDDVRGALEKVAAHLAPVEIQDSDYMLHETYQGQPIRKFAAYDPTSTIESAEAFFDNRHRYPLAWRQKTARALIKKARENDADIPDHISNYLFKAAGFGFPSQAAIENGLVGRLNHITHTRKTAGEKLAQALGAIADSPALRYNHDLVTDMLEITDRFDREMKLAAFYDSDVDLPEEMLELTTPMIKQAGEVEHGGSVSLQNGQSVNVHRLSKEALEAVDDALVNMPKTKLAKVLPTLPAPDADVLCKAAGVVKTAKPIFERPGLDPKPATKPSKGTKAIGAPKSNEDLAKGAMEAPMPGMGAPPPAPGAMPGPGAIPGGAAPGAVPSPGMGGAPAPGAPEPAPNLPETPGQAEKPGQDAASMDPTGSMGAAPGAAGGTGMAPDANPGAPVAPEGGAPFDDPGILDDPMIAAQASPSAPGADDASTLMAGAAAEEGAAGMPGEPMGAPDPAAAAVMKDQVSGIPQV